MKVKIEIVFVFIIFICIVILELLTNYVSEKSVNAISEEVNQVIERLEYARKLKKDGILDDNTKSDLKIKIENLKKNWEKEEEKLSIFAEHDELEKVTKCIIVLEENSKNEEYESALEDGIEFIYWLNHFKDKDKLAWKNIF